MCEEGLADSWAYDVIVTCVHNCPRLHGPESYEPMKPAVQLEHASGKSSLSLTSVEGGLWSLCCPGFV